MRRLKSSVMVRPNAAQMFGQHNSNFQATLVGVEEI